MNTTDLVHYLALDSPDRPAAEHRAPAQSYLQLAAPVRSSILRARQHVQREQSAAGSWTGRQVGDPALAGRLVALLAFLGREPSLLAEQTAESIRRDQRSDGGWSAVPDGPVDLSISVQAYFALKLTGEDASLPAMRRARQIIRQLGGAGAADMTTRLWLALFGQVDYDRCRPMVPEWLLLPRRGMQRACGAAGSDASYQRLTALAVVWALRPRREVEMSRGVRELFVKPPQRWAMVGEYLPRAARRPWAHMRRLWIEAAWRHCESRGLVPLRRRAMELAEALLVEDAARAEIRETGFEDLAWQRIALAALGIADDHPATASCEARLRRLIVVNDASETARPQPGTTSLTDTALAIAALRASGAPSHQAALTAGLNWLAAVRRQRRWPSSRSVGSAPESAALLSAFACATIDDCESALPPEIQVAGNRWESLRRRPRRSELPRRRMSRCAEQLCEELLRRQNSDGGWSAECCAELPRRARGVIRASDRGPARRSAPDATGTVMQALAQAAVASPARSSTRHEAIARGAAFLRATQRADGSWESATGMRLLHGTSLAIRGLAAAGAPGNDPAVAAGVNWLLVHQLETGGWGETDSSCAQRGEVTAAPATAIQTAWALSALVAAGYAEHDAAHRAVEFLLDTQEEDGRWNDLQFTARDAADGRWYRNELHSSAVPLIALARWIAAAAAIHIEAEPVRLRLVSDSSFARFHTSGI